MFYIRTHLPKRPAQKFTFSVSLILWGRKCEFQCGPFWKECAYKKQTLDFTHPFPRKYIVQHLENSYMYISVIPFWETHHRQV